MEEDQACTVQIPDSRVRGNRLLSSRAWAGGTRIPKQLALASEVPGRNLHIWERSIWEEASSVSSG